MKETYYFPHDYHSRHDLKLSDLIYTKGMEALGVYWCLVEMLYENEGFLPMKYERIANELRTTKECITTVVEDFDLFKNDSVIFWSNSVLSRLEHRNLKSEMARTSINKRWDNIRSKYDGNTIKESKVKESKVNNIVFDFLSVWNKYPNKDGKKQALRFFNASVKTEQDFKDINIALENYLKSEPVAKGFIKNGSTWFNNWRDWIVPPKGGLYDDRPEYLRPKPAKT